MVGCQTELGNCGSDMMLLIDVIEEQVRVMCEEGWGELGGCRILVSDPSGRD